MSTAHELFELCMLGGAPERRYRKLRPEVEQLPWGTLETKQLSQETILAGRRTWTLAAYQEHRTGAACAATLEALIAARAPLDLIAVATRFPLDEMVHVEMCARLTAELGGATPLLHPAGALVPHPRGDLPPLLRAAELVVRVFCVGEAVSIPLLRGSWRSATHPLIKSVLGHIVKDEAAHGRFGWMFLDWASEALGPEERAHLSAVARDEIGKLETNWQAAVKQGATGDSLGWMDASTYLPLARRSLAVEVCEPLAARGLLGPAPHSA
jgi:hypothetical protein